MYVPEYVSQLCGSSAARNKRSSPDRAIQGQHGSRRIHDRTPQGVGRPDGANIAQIRSNARSFSTYPVTACTVPFFFEYRFTAWGIAWACDGSVEVLHRADV